MLHFDVRLQNKIFSARLNGKNPKIFLYSLSEKYVLKKISSHLKNSQNNGINLQDWQLYGTHGTKNHCCNLKQERNNGKVGALDFFVSFAFIFLSYICMLGSQKSLLPVYVGSLGKGVVPLA